VHEKVEKPCFSSVLLAKVAGAEPSGGMNVQKVHPAVAPSEFRSQKVKATACSKPKNTFCQNIHKIPQDILPKYPKGSTRQSTSPFWGTGPDIFQG
jgi:hypothetical protein